MAEINPTATHGINMYSPVSPTASADASDFTANFWGDDGFSFGDFLDLINPLQHIPIVGTLYRAATGDDISTGSSILGGGLFGGILGAGAAVVNAVIEEATGGKIVDHMTSMFSDEDAPETAVLASAEIQNGNRAAFGRGAQEATWSDSISNQPAAPAAATPVERSYAQNPASGRGAQEATMTSVASYSPASATPALAAQADLAPAMVAPTGETTDPAWLVAIPRVENDAYITAAMPYVTPEMGLQLIQATAGNTDYTSLPGPVDAIDHYSHQALAAKILTTKPAIVNSLY